MYAIVCTGGKQYKVSEGDVIEVEKLNAEVGTNVNLEVLMLVDGKTVKANKGEVVAEVLSHGKEEKVVVFKYKPKKHSKTRQGHRQPFTTLKIVSVK